MISSRSLALMFAVTVPILAGCGSLRQWWHNDLKVGPNYCRPVVPTAGDWIEAQDPAVTTSEAQADWWRTFEDPVLEQLVLAAYQRNLSLRAAGLRVLEARTQRNIAAANLLPQSQTLFGRYTRNQISTTTANVFPGVARTFDDWQTGFDLSWEIDVWGRIRRNIEASDAVLDAQIESYDNILVTLIGDVVATYIQLRSFDQRITLAEQNVGIQQGSLKIAEARFNAGRVSELDVQQAASNLADTRALIPSLQLGRRQSLNVLAILLGTTPFELEPILAERGEIPHAPEEVLVGIPADLLRRRPDIRAAERAIAAQSAQIGIAEADLYPQFALGGEMKLNSQQFRNLFSSSSAAGFISPGFQWNILNYGRLVNNVRVQDIRYREAIVDYENAVLAAHREVEDAMVLFLRSKERVAELEKSAKAAARSVELVRLQYKEGAVDFGRVFVLENTLVGAQDRLIATQGEVAVALAQIYKALGGGWQLRHWTRYVADYDLTSIGASQLSEPASDARLVEPPIPLPPIDDFEQDSDLQPDAGVGDV